MIKLGYSTSGLTNLNLFEAIHAVENAGFSGIELSFHKTQLNPFQMTDQDILCLKKELEKKNIQAACIAPATFFFLDERPHDPSLLCADLAGQKQRIRLIKEAIRFAKLLKAPLVSFGSGFIREKDDAINPEALLIDSILECLEDIGDIVLTIEPEPGMYIETLEQGVNLVKKINSKNFQLHIDFCHAFCSEKNYIEAIRQAAPYTKYLHISDTTDGYNLKVLPFTEDLSCDLNHANYLIYFPATADFLFMDPDHAFYFYDKALNEKQKEAINQIAQKTNHQIVQYIDYNQLFMGLSPYYSEIQVYAISIPNFSFAIIDRIKPIVHYLKTTNRDKTGLPIIEKKVANTITGKVHFHDTLGTGQIDFPTCFKVLKENNFSGYAMVELYHHVDIWESTLQQSFTFLSQCLNTIQEEATLC